MTTVLNSPECIALIESLVFWDSKRPITKKLLSRLDLNRLPIDVEVTTYRAQLLAGESGLEFDPKRARRIIGNFGAESVVGLPLF